MKKSMITGMMESLWYGTDAALHEYLNIQGQIDARMVSFTGQPPEEEEPYLLSIEGNIGRIKIHGAISNSQSWFDSLFERATYPAIREAVIAAASNDAVEHILLDVNSGGGAVNGVSDTANLIRLINDSVKPVTAYTDGGMLSAAYWLSSAAGRVYASNVAMVGSIGVITTHQEYSKALKDEGVGVTVMRAGKYKALANSVEPLTAQAKEIIQEHLDEAYKIFVQHVSDMRGESYAHVDSHMAQGREFMGEQALQAGLVDKIMSYEDVIAQIQVESVDKSKGFFDNPRSPTQGIEPMKKRAISSAVLAALAAAGSQPAVAASAEPAPAPAPVVPSQPEPNAAAPVAAAPAAAPAAPAAAAPEPVAPQNAAIVEYLQGQVRDKDTQILNANIELGQLRAKLADMEASHTGLKEIVAKSISTMQVGLGGSAIDATNMSAVALLAEHKRVSETFQSKFKAGGVAAVDAAQASGKGAVVLDPITRSRLAAVRATA